MNINKQNKTNKLKVTILKDGSVVRTKIFGYRKINRFEPDSSNVISNK